MITPPKKCVLKEKFPLAHLHLVAATVREDDRHIGGHCRSLLWGKKTEDGEGVE